MKHGSKQKGYANNDFFAGFMVLALITWLPASWLTHIIICLDEEKWGFLIAGAIMFPIAIIHGTGAWFGAW